MLFTFLKKILKRPFKMKPKKVLVYCMYAGASFDLWKINCSVLETAT